MTRGRARSLDPFAYQEPEPPFDIRGLIEAFESERDAEAERDARLRSLSAVGTARARRLAGALAACAPDERCLLGVCPLCTRQLRIWATAQALELFDGEPDLIAPTLVPAGAAFPPGELGAFDPRRFNDMLRQRMRRVGLGGEPVYGGLHGDYDARHGLLQPHHHLIAPACAPLPGCRTASPRSPSGLSAGRGPTQGRSCPDRLQARDPWCGQAPLGQREGESNHVGGQRQPGDEPL
jgi:hypothetical protein